MNPDHDLERARTGQISGWSEAGSNHRLPVHSREGQGRLQLVPQPRHRNADTCRFSWSEDFDCIFRNEGSRVQIPSAPRFPIEFGCESPVGLSHLGSGWCVSLSGPASVPGRQWLRFLCPTRFTSDRLVLIFTRALRSRGGSENAWGAVRG
jgi:hypothetical protein